MNSAGIWKAWQQGIERKNRELKALRAKVEHRSADTLATEPLQMTEKEQVEEDKAVRQECELRLAPFLWSLSVTRAAWTTMSVEGRQDLLRRCQGSRGIVL